jgi:hypothetical protein
MGAFTLTARTFPGELAELERILGDMGVDAPEGTAKVRGTASVQDACMAGRCKMLPWLRKAALPAIGIQVAHAMEFGEGSVRAGCRVEPGRNNQLAA